MTVTERLLRQIDRNAELLSEIKAVISLSPPGVARYVLEGFAEELERDLEVLIARVGLRVAP